MWLKARLICLTLTSSSSLVRSAPRLGTFAVTSGASFIRSARGGLAGLNLRSYIYPRPPNGSGGSVIVIS
jgi:hypothetical protein